MIAVGGGIGSVLRYAVETGLPHDGDSFPSATLLINLVGSLLLGALVVAVTEVRRGHPLLRPALGTGLLGGFTTFSTFAVETRAAPGAIAVAYVATSLVGGVLLAQLGMLAVRRVAHGVIGLPRDDDIDPIDPDLP